jgi:hypothetical protein
MTRPEVQPRRRVGRPSSCPPDVLDRVVQLRVGGARLIDISTLMNDDGVQTPGGGRRWWPQHVSRLLKTLDAQTLIEEYSERASSHRRPATTTPHIA